MRPEFLNRPGVWTRTPRVSQSPAEYAESIHKAEVKRQGEAADSVIAWAAVMFLIVWFVLALAGTVGG